MEHKEVAARTLKALGGEENIIALAQIIQHHAQARGTVGKGNNVFFAA